MSTATASQYRANVLFRVLAFLDNTGTQAFALSSEVDADGRFLHPDDVFREGTAIAGILAAALRALRSNVHRFFASPEEAAALLHVIGAGAAEAKVRTWDCMTWIDTTANADASAAPHAATSVEGGASNEVKPSSSSAHASTPAETPWSFLLCHPVSLVDYAEQLENELPIHLLVRLREVLGVSGAVEVDAESTTAGPSASFSSTPLVEQLLIDGLDEWMRGCPIEEVRRIILACGVQPAVLETAFQPAPPQQATETAESGASGLPESLVDFVVDVVFPVTAAASAGSSAATTQSTTAESPQDWLLLSYERNREVIEVGEDDDDDDGDVDADGGEGDARDSTSGNPRKVPRAEASLSTSQADSLGAWQPTDGEEVLTADNIDRYLTECPQRIPKEILREKRKAICNAAITAFELEHHYSAAELRRAVREEVGTMTAPEASAFMGCPISIEQVREAARATRKAQFVEWVLAAHGKQAGTIDS